MMNGYINNHEGEIGLLILFCATPVSNTGLDFFSFVLLSQFIYSWLKAVTFSTITIKWWFFSLRALSCYQMERTAPIHSPINAELARCSKSQVVSYYFHAIADFLWYYKCQTDWQAFVQLDVDFLSIKLVSVPHSFKKWGWNISY